MWSQDEADEFEAEPSGHTVLHNSIVMESGEAAPGTVEELVAAPRESDLLYIPFLHHMNIVNPFKGLVTASSRFGALLLKEDESVVVPYNVRPTQSLFDIFGDQVAWLSEKQAVANVSSSYGARNSTAIILPALMRVDGLEISHSNSST